MPGGSGRDSSSRKLASAVRLAASAGKSATLAALNSGTGRSSHYFSPSSSSSSRGGSAGAPAKARVRALVDRHQPALLKNAAVSVQVEHWHEETRRWSQGATATVTKSSVVIESACGFLRLSTSPLRVEHSTPLSRDFHLELVSERRRQRLAVYSEDDGERLIAALERGGAQVVQRRVLPAPRRSKLRPISEGQPLSALKVAVEDKTRPLSEGMDGQRKSLSRRKSTGSSDNCESPPRYYSNTPARVMRTSSSGEDNVTKTARDASSTSSVLWCRRYGEEKNAVGVEEGRGLSTGSTRMRRRKLHSRSDQSLNSDELSNSGSNKEEEEEDDEDSEVFYYESSSTEVDNDADITDGGLFKVLKHKKDRLGIQERRHDNDIRSDKLDKFRFLLDDDNSLLDPAEFGATGDFIRSDFDDYPQLSEVPASAESTSNDLRAQMPSWIRKSFEELELEVNSTKHEMRRRSSQTSLLSSTSSFSHQQRMRLQGSSSVASSASPTFSPVRTPTEKTSDAREFLFHDSSNRQQENEPRLLQQVVSGKKRRRGDKSAVVLLFNEADPSTEV